MTEVERVLQELLHDLRTPLGVAQGYLRLIRDGRLAEGADRDRAIEQATAALADMARLCDTATAALDGIQKTVRTHGHT